MQFTFTITDSDDAKRLEDDLRRDARIYTRSKKANGQSNVGKQFSLGDSRSGMSKGRQAGGPLARPANEVPSSPCRIRLPVRGRRVRSADWVVPKRCEIADHVPEAYNCGRERRLRRGHLSSPAGFLSSFPSVTSRERAAVSAAATKRLHSRVSAS